MNDRKNVKYSNDFDKCKRCNTESHRFNKDAKFILIE